MNKTQQINGGRDLYTASNGGEIHRVQHATVLCFADLKQAFNRVRLTDVIRLLRDNNISELGASLEKEEWTTIIQQNWHM